MTSLLVSNNQKPITILVTGANGQLGKTIEELFEDNNDNLNFVFVSKTELDITDEESLKQYFIENHFDYCINCAAYTNVEQAEKTPEMAFKVNAEGVKSLAEVCKETNTILIHISTDYVFDGDKQEPYTVEDIPNPINEYGKSKFLGERYIQDILGKYYIIRTSWLYSKRYGKNFYRTILEKAKTEKELFVTDEQVGRPTDAINLAEYIIDLILSQSKKYGIKHFCDKEVLTWFDFAKLILIENSLSSEVLLVRAKNYRTFAKRPKNSILQKI